MSFRSLAAVAAFLIATGGISTAQALPGQDDKPHFTPVYLSFVPGLSIPLGSWDVMVSGAAIGGAVHDVDGVMGAGVFNLSHDVRGLQSAGVFNLATHVTGLQLGVINIAETLDGIQIGLINIAKDGINGVGAMFEPQSGFAWGYWQNGSPYLYTVLSAGLPLAEMGSKPEGLLGAVGFGTRLGGERGSASLDFEVLAAQSLGLRLIALCEGKAATKDSSIPWPELRLRLGLPISRQLSLIGGLVTDLDVAGAPGLPEILRTGWAFDSRFFGLAFTAYTRWYLGLRIQA